MIGKSHILLGAILMACAAGMGGFVYGTHVGVAQEQATQKRANDAKEAARIQLQAQIDSAAQQAQDAEYARQTQVRDIHNETYKIIEKPVYRTVCLDPDGVGLLDRAAATANADDIFNIVGDTRPITHRIAE